MDVENTGIKTVGNWALSGNVLFLDLLSFETVFMKQTALLLFIAFATTGCEKGKNAPTSTGATTTTRTTALTDSSILGSYTGNVVYISGYFNDSTFRYDTTTYTTSALARVSRWGTDSFVVYCDSIIFFYYSDPAKRALAFDSTHIYAPPFGQMAFSADDDTLHLTVIHNFMVNATSAFQDYIFYGHK